MSAHAGTVVAVCLSPEPGLPKHPQPEVIIGPHGVEGDYHAGPTRYSRRSGGPVENDRQVSIVAQEAVEDACAALGIEVPPGGLGENILLRGLGDLSHLRPGQRLRFSSGVELEVTAQNIPCDNLTVYHPQLPTRLYGRRGVVAVVRVPGTLRPGDTAAVLPS